MMCGHVYLLHFATPLGDPARSHAWASHYIGWALDAEQRLAEHLAGRGAAITRAAVQRGIRLEIVRTWPGTRDLERLLKSFKHGPRFCPICCKHHGWRCRDLPAALQLALPLDDDADLPEVLLSEMDSYECFMLQRFRTARAQRFDLGDTAAWDIPF
jgi:hypothetical protein